MANIKTSLKKVSKETLTSALALLIQELLANGADIQGTGSTKKPKTSKTPSKQMKVSP